MNHRVVRVLAVDFVFMVTGLRTAGSEGDNSWIWFWLAGTTTFAVDMVALAWLGLWIGLTARRANRATRATVARIMSLPWGTWFFAFLIPGTLNLKLWRPNNEGAFLLGSWFVVSMIISVAFCLWARHRLFHNLREVATQRFTPKASRFDRLFRPLKKNPALPPPIPSET